jgi:hypothetical protein
MNGFRVGEVVLNPPGAIRRAILFATVLVPSIPFVFILSYVRIC